MIQVSSKQASPNLSLSSLGRVALVGDFDSISLYDYKGQTEDAFSTNGSQALLTRYPDGSFESTDQSDAYIMSMCPFVSKDGTLNGIVVGGNFTSLGGVESQGIALYNPNTSRVQNLTGISGQVNAVYCDSSSGVVYVGGSFMAGNSTNAMSWTSGWTNLPFEGFNGPVNAITKNSAGNIVFGGSFDGLGNTTTPNERDAQVINIGSGNITSSGSSTTPGFRDPRNIICKTAAQSGAGNTWLLADKTQGWWEGDYNFGFNPTKLRLYQTQQSNRGTKTWYFENLDQGGILEFEYLDTNGRNQTCSEVCPLPQGNSTYQDFRFLPSVGMNTFRIYITSWYGEGGGLDGLEMFQDDIYSFAINDFNEPKCDDVSTGSSSTVTPATGLWTQQPQGDGTSAYLSAYLDSSSELSSNISVVFTPSIRQSGNYSVTVYTPGCKRDSSCSTRGQVNMTGSMTSGGSPVAVTIYQTNNYDKFDQVYYGYVDVDTDNFKPSITLTPLPNQNLPVTVVAQRVGFELITTTGGLNGLYEYNPNEAVVSTDFTTSVIDMAGANLSTGATINAIAQSGDALYVAGNFSGDGISNVMEVGTDATALANGGLNANVAVIYANGSTLYFAGNFTNTADQSVTGLENIASYDTSGKKWSPLGAGVNGPVCEMVPLTINVTGSGDSEESLTVTGDFTSVNSFSGNAAFTAQGFAIWVPSRKNWLNNIQGADASVNGKLDAYTTVPGSSPLYAGQITSQELDYSGAVELSGDGDPTLESMGVNIEAANSSSSSKTKRAISTTGYSGVYEGTFYNSSSLSLAILGGHFTAKASNGSTVENLIFVNDTSTRTLTGVSGLDSESTFLAMDTYETSLYAGGSVTGTVNGNSVNGLIVYDLVGANFAGTQPPALAGTNVTVNAIAVQPNNPNVYVGGSFALAGSLSCASLCYYDASTMQWNTPGAGLSGTITNMVWSAQNTLIIAGNLTVNGNATTMVSYDAKKQVFTTYSGASTLPGPITALTPANSDYNQWWAAGTATSNGSAYLSKYNEGTWTAASGFGAGTVIRGLQVLTLTSNHDNTNLVRDDEVLLVNGAINIPDYGNASAALFNGTAFTPFVLTNKQDGSEGTISRMFVSNTSNLMNKDGHHLAVGLVVLISLAIALGLTFLIIVAGIFIERHRRRKEGYVPMTTMRMDRTGNLSRIPPESLLGTLGEKDGAPKI
ncbi:hypothetical protein EJ03DRAFT_344878 [Teratosphaeria nubilosa]|uniref:Cellular morphogenesis protein n=1 Tax=Teratosphaeria nubilosa TaxID=161662 RepID=A0A6G1L3C3_9PEZI|nr:hypothetical protein EJ03DRAFT_344878 [Teratosphaeria nubilosa]